MICKINGNEFNVPSDVSQISLGKFVDWYDAHGKNLDEELNEILQNSEEVDIDVQLHLNKEALCWYSFFTGFDFLTSTDQDLTDILIQYRILKNLLRESVEESKAFPYIFEWEEEKWCIQDYKIDSNSTMSFGELVTGKEVAKQISALSKSKWEALIYLCCIYLRKEGEEFTDDLMSRAELMKTLPFNHALNVGFFLNNSINIFNLNFQSLIQKTVQQKQL